VRLCEVFLGNVGSNLFNIVFHEQLQTISMRCNVRKWTHVLLVNTPCSHLHSFCATDVSSGLANRVTLTRASRNMLEGSVTRRRTNFWFDICIVVRDCCWVAF
jgi:hypothetical protein